MSTCVNIIPKKETFENENDNKKDFQQSELAHDSWQAMETAKSTYGVLKTAHKDWVREYANHLLPMYEIEKHFQLIRKVQARN